MSSEKTASGPADLPDGLTALLADEAVWAEPPAGGLDRLLTELGGPRSTVTSLPSRAADRTARAQRRRWRTAAALAAAAVAVFAAGLMFGNAGDDSGEAASPDAGDPPVAVFSVLGTPVAPDAVADVEVFDRGAGYALILDTRGLAPAPDGSFYQGWLRSAAGEQVSVGTFHMRGGDDIVVLWSGVPLSRYPTLVVTRHDAGGSVTGEEVLIGDVET
jgi:hypothetical protein